MSTSPWANNGAKHKTHCKRGHPLTETACYYRLRQIDELTTRLVRDCKQCCKVRNAKKISQGGANLKTGAPIKAYCKRGHQLTSESCYLHPNGQRECKQCCKVRYMQYLDRLERQRHENL